jgi:hypothetical protein
MLVRTQHALPGGVKYKKGNTDACNCGIALEVSALTRFEGLVAGGARQVRANATASILYGQIGSRAPAGGYG